MKNKILFCLKSFIVILLCYHSFLFAGEQEQVATLSASINKKFTLGATVPVVCKFDDSSIMAVINGDYHTKEPTGFTASVINSTTLEETKKIQIKVDASFTLYSGNTIQKIVPLKNTGNFIAIDPNRLMLWQDDRKDNELTCIVLKEINGDMPRPIRDRVCGTTSHSSENRVKDVIQLKNGNIAVLIGGQVEIWSSEKEFEQEIEQEIWKHTSTRTVEDACEVIHEASNNILVIQHFQKSQFEVLKLHNDDNAMKLQSSNSNLRIKTRIRTMCLLSNEDIAISRDCTMQIIKPGVDRTYKSAAFEFDTVPRDNTAPYRSMVKIIELEDKRLLLCPRGDVSYNEKNPLELWKYKGCLRGDWVKVLALKMPEVFTKNPIVINIFQMQSQEIVALIADKLRHEKECPQWVRWDLDDDWTQPSEPIRDYRDYGQSSLVEQHLSGHIKKL